MKSINSKLEIKHCKEVLDSETFIGSDKAWDGRTKKFTFNTWVNEYVVWHGEERVDSGQALEELLQVYNEL